MTEKVKDSVLPDGTPAKILTQAQVDVLLEMIEERLWKHGLKKRMAVVSRYAVLGATGLVGLSLWWPWIRRLVSFVIIDIPQ